MTEYEAQSACRQLSSARAPIPGEQLAYTIDRVIGDAGEHVAQVSLGVEAIHPGRLGESVHGGSVRAARIEPANGLIVPGHVLPHTGQESSSTIAGIPSADRADAASRLSGAQ